METHNEAYLSLFQMSRKKNYRESVGGLFSVRRKRLAKADRCKESKLRRYSRPEGKEYSPVLSHCRRSDFK